MMLIVEVLKKNAYEGDHNYIAQFRQQCNCEPARQSTYVLMFSFQKLDTVYVSVYRSGPWQWNSLIFLTASV